MLRLRTLGGLSIENAASTGGATAQRRPLALLALLAVAGGRGLSRDKIIALLWPETDDEHGRNSLSQVISLLRRELAADDLVLGTAELRVNADVLACDVIEFEQRIAADDLEASHRSLHRAVSRRRLSARTRPSSSAGWTRSGRDSSTCKATPSSGWPREPTAAGDHVSAVRFWRQRAGLAPSDSRAALKLMESLVAVG